MSAPRRQMSKSTYKIVKFFFIYFAFFQTIASLALIAHAIHSDQRWPIPVILFIIYVLPPLLNRLMNARYPMRQGATSVKIDEYNAWINSYRLQKLFTIFTFLERALFLVPGLYPAWLRLWGSKIGKGVYILPGVEIVDRGNLELGDFVFIGNKSYLSPHVAMNKNGKMFVYVKNIKIEDHVFIGAFCKLGPGTKISKGEAVPAGSAYFLNSTKPNLSQTD